MIMPERLDDAEIVARGLALAESHELQQVRLDMAREQAWLADEHRYETNREVGEAFRRGELELVGQTDAFLPIATLREAANFDKHQPYLTPGAIAVLDVLGDFGQRKLRAAGVGGEIRFPITSMVRAEERQAEIAAQPGKLALSPRESGHPTGWDVDMDSSSYYLRENDVWKSVSRRDPEKQREIGRARARQLGRVALPTPIANPSRYNPHVRIALHEAVAELYAAGLLSPVVEYANTAHELIHVGINPKTGSANDSSLLQ